MLPRSTEIRPHVAADSSPPPLPLASSHPRPWRLIGGHPRRGERGRSRKRNLFGDFRTACVPDSPYPPPVHWRGMPRAADGRACGDGRCHPLCSGSLLPVSFCPVGELRFDASVEATRANYSCVSVYGGMSCTSIGSMCCHAALVFLSWQSGNALRPCPLILGASPLPPILKNVPNEPYEHMHGCSAAAMAGCENEEGAYGGTVAGMCRKIRARDGGVICRKNRARKK